MSPQFRHLSIHVILVQCAFAPEQPYCSVQCKLQMSSKYFRVDRSLIPLHHYALSAAACALLSTVVVKGVCGSLARCGTRAAV